MSNPIHALYALGQSLWYDNIHRALLRNGELEAMIARGDIYGVTSNPSIFRAAIVDSDAYTADIARLAADGLDAEQIYEHLAVEDIRAACDLFRPLYERTQGGDGYVSLEVSPYLAHDTEATLSEAKRLWALVDRPNLMIKIPGTLKGLPAITEAIAAGVNVNVTLLFSVRRYRQVMDAYMRGLEKRRQAGLPLDEVASVASFFVSRVDTLVDRLLAEKGERGAALQGRIAVANTKMAYQAFKQVFATERWQALEQAGARVQRPLWASTSTKNPAYSDVKYVEELIGPQTVNTVPPHTLDAFRDHGQVALTVEADLEAAKQALSDLSALGISMDAVTQQLEEEGVQKFADAFTALLDAVEAQRVQAR